jgi:hypothetical protein
MRAVAVDSAVANRCCSSASIAAMSGQRLMSGAMRPGWLLVSMSRSARWRVVTTRSALLSVSGTSSLRSVLLKRVMGSICAPITSAMRSRRPDGCPGVSPSPNPCTRTLDIQDPNLCCHLNRERKDYTTKAAIRGSRAACVAEFSVASACGCGTRRGNTCDTAGASVGRRARPPGVGRCAVRR